MNNLTVLIIDIVILLFNSISLFISESKIVKGLNVTVVALTIINLIRM